MINHIEHFLSIEDAKAIKSIPLGDLNKDDSLIWPREKAGKYKVKSGYHCLTSKLVVPEVGKPSSSHQIDSKVWKVIWNSGLLPKISNFLWRDISNALPCFSNLFKKKVIPSPLCSLCGQYPETIEHCLLLCPWTKRVWFGSSLGYPPKLEEISTLDCWLLRTIEEGSKLVDDPSIFLELLGFILFEIWKMRCAAIYKNGFVNPDIVISNANFSSLEWANVKMVNDSLTSTPLTSSSILLGSLHLRTLSRST
ncbi:uncharacterized protein LOC112198935 [Rosa chinensis]|uniref:uncharacterized protein LOC112198935 n=1 Tax=Rosa chinensis TaxID=74649 RepID=UPI000D087D93|nr:uncharacterized protein LOC112198935 [Rosa chinensis]